MKINYVSIIYSTNYLHCDNIPSRFNRMPLLFEIGVPSSTRKGRLILT